MPRRDGAAPGLLVRFVAGALVMLIAVVALGRIDSYWADFGAIALLAGLVATLGVAIQRQLGEDDPSEPRRASRVRLGRQGKEPPRDRRQAPRRR